jgi:hypothetical protein
MSIKSSKVKIHITTILIVLSSVGFLPTFSSAGNKTNKTKQTKSIVKREDAAKIKPSKKILKKDLWDDVIFAFQDAVKTCFEEIQLKNPKSYGISASLFKTQQGKSHHQRNLRKHTVSKIASLITKTASIDWKNKSLASSFDNKIIYWTDSQRRQHAAAFTTEWWVDQQSSPNEHHIRFTFDQLWIQKDIKKPMTSYISPPISREVSFTRPEKP